MIKAPFDRSKIPHKPGVYQFKDGYGKIIYVGKAIDLYSRVSSYFASYQENPKTSALVLEIASLEYSEQVGLNLHECPKRLIKIGDTNFLYNLTPNLVIFKSFI